MAFGIGINLTVKGDEHLIRALAKLRGATVRKIVRPAVRSAIVPINKAAKANAPKRVPIEGYAGGQLKKSIGVAVRTYRNGTVWGGIGPRRGFKIVIAGLHPKTIDPVHYAHLVEGGTRHSAAEPFMRKAFDENKAKAQHILKQKIWSGIAAEVA